ALHQARHGGNGADGPGVREGDRAAREVVGEEPTGARLLDQRLVGRVERREIHPLGVLDHRHDERAAAVLLLHVHREAEVNPAGSGERGAVLGGAAEGSAACSPLRNTSARLVGITGRSASRPLSNSCRHSSPTEAGSRRYCSYITCTNAALWVPKTNSLTRPAASSSA